MEHNLITRPPVRRPNNDLFEGFIFVLHPAGFKYHKLTKSQILLHYERGPESLAYQYGDQNCVVYSAVGHAPNEKSML